MVRNGMCLAYYWCFTGIKAGFLSIRRAPGNEDFPSIVITWTPFWAVALFPVLIEALGRKPPVKHPQSFSLLNESNLIPQTILRGRELALSKTPLWESVKLTPFYCSAHSNLQNRLNNTSESSNFPLQTPKYETHNCVSGKS